MPIDVVTARDLLGLIRALYAAELSGARRRRKLVRLRRCAVYVQRAHDHAMDGRAAEAEAAWRRAAVLLLAETDVTEELRPVLLAAAQRVGNHR